MHRMIYRISLFIVITMALPVVATSADFSRKLTLLVLGDSLSAAYNMPLERGWVNLLQQRVAKTYPETHIVNASVTGETAENAVRRLPALIERHAPDVIVIELGGNDGLRGFQLENIRQSLQTLIDTAKGAGAEVVLTGIHLNPNYGPRFNQLFFGMYRELAEENRVHYVPFILEGIGDDPEKMQEDAVHPTAEAQAEVLENMWPAVEQAIRAAETKNPESRSQNSE
ncbi:MAG TPA: arylesterase [Gammaproteobacteria bacterium]